MSITLQCRGATSYVVTLPQDKAAVSKLLKGALGYTDLSNTYLNRKFGKRLYATEFSAFNTQDMSYPAGLDARVEALLRASYEVEVDRVSIPPWSDEDGDLYWYQNEAANRLLLGRSGHASVPTGGGKSHIIASLVHRLPPGNKVVVVPSSEILVQMHKLLESKSGGRVSRLGGGVGDVQADGGLLVGTYQTICSRIDGSDEFLTRFLFNARSVIVDECHHCPCDSIQKIVRYSKNLEFQYGLSATADRSDGLGIVMEGLVGPLVYSIDPQTLVRGGFITPGVLFMTDIPKGTGLGGVKGDYSAIYRDCLVGSAARRAQEVAACCQAMTLGLTTMCFVKQVRHGQDLYDALKRGGIDGADVALLTGESGKAVRKGVLGRLSSGDLKLVVATIGKEGLDVPGIDAVILAGGGADPRQEVGRALRSKTGKSKAYVWDFYDNQHPALARQSKARLQWFKESGIFEVNRI